MDKLKKGDKTIAASTAVIMAAVIAAAAGIISSVLSYRAGIATIELPLHATQTAEANQSYTSTANQVNIPIAVDASKPWQPTGVFATIGDIVNITVVGGKWTLARKPFPDEVRDELSNEAKDKLASEIWMNDWRETDGSGSASLCNSIEDCPIYNYRAGALIARIGNTNYTVGNKCSFIAADTGQVFLQTNDFSSAYYDNFGVLAVEINLGVKNTSPVATSCGKPYP